MRFIFILPFLSQLLIQTVVSQPDDPGANPFGQMNCKSFSCPKGNAPVPKSRIKFESSGCATMGGGMMMMYGGGDNDDKFAPCCDQWHACYQMCGTSKKTCDARFKTCSKRECLGNEKCSKGAELKSMMVEMGGCEKFDELQNAACRCVSDDKVEGVRHDAIRAFYKKYSPESMDKVPQLSKKVETPGKMAALFLKLLEKYPKAIKKVRDSQFEMYDQIDQMMKKQERDEKKEKANKKIEEEIADEIDDDDDDNEKMEL